MRLKTVSMLVAIVCWEVGCTTFPHFSDNGDEALHRAESASLGPSDLIYGQTAASQGDWSTALMFFARSYREKPSILNEFNLATAYERTGKGALAVALYLDLVDRGRFTEVTPVQNANGTFDQKAPASDIADEARDRLIRMHATGLRSDQNVTQPAQ